MTENRENHIFYLGQSMFPVLREGDHILFHAPADRPVLRGDVIVFSPPGEDRIVIHRVIRIGPEGVRTRGDRNGSADPWLLKKDDILGIAIRCRRRGEDRAIAGGAGGLLHAAVSGFLTDLLAGIVRILDPLLKSGFYRGALAGWVPERHKPRVLAIRRPEGTEFMLVMGKQVAGRRFAGNQYWQIRKRFRPFVRMENSELKSEK